MSLETKIISLVQAIGTDIKSLTTNQGSLSSLTTTNKNSLVAALNELRSLVIVIDSNYTTIDDASTVANKTWSSTKISSSITNAVNALVASSPTTLDTLNELAIALGNDPNFATTLATQISKRVRFDASQTLTSSEMLQVCTNIGIGDYDHDFVSDYNTAKA